jgi:hypothetical protein|eukprot:m.183760 g.183760  ORF g.183760 m.183760 type:complete len:418 (-) comp24670_c0_seq1:120-1373(-)
MADAADDPMLFFAGFDDIRMDLDLDIPRLARDDDGFTEERNLTEADTADMAVHGVFLPPPVVWGLVVKEAHFNRAVHTIDGGAFAGREDLVRAIWHPAPVGARDPNPVALYTFIRELDHYEPGLTALIKTFVPITAWMAGMIGPEAFEGCVALREVTLPRSVTILGPRSFAGCTSLHHFDFPASITEIRDHVFARSGLARVRLSASLKRVGEWAFAHCVLLTSINLPDSLIFLSDFTFSGCTSLTEVSFSSSLAVIGASAFSECTRLHTATIPASVARVGEHAFHDCTLLTSVSLPDGLTEIAPYTFSRCTSLRKLTVPKTVTLIGHHAFSGCAALGDIVLGECVASIERYAFTGCGFGTVVLPDAVTSVGNNAFSRCRLLTVISVGRSLLADLVDEDPSIVEACTVWIGITVRPPS